MKSKGRGVEATLKAIKKQLLDLAVDAFDKPESKKQLRELMSSPFFEEHFPWFWDELLSRNSFLSEFYMEMRLQPLAETPFKDCQSIFKQLSERKSYFNVYEWLDDKSSEIPWCRNVLEKLGHYNELSYNNINDDRARNEERKRKQYRQHRRVEFWLCFLTFSTGVFFAVSYKLPSWINDGAYWSLGAFSILMALMLWGAFIRAKEYAYGADVTVFGDLEVSRTVVQWCSAFGPLSLAYIYWGKIDGLIRMIAIAIAIGVPFIPFIREASVSVAIGIACGFASLLLAPFAGRFLENAFIWITTSGS